jgi:hypothetical protein
LFSPKLKIRLMSHGDWYSDFFETLWQAQTLSDLATNRKATQSSLFSFGFGSKEKAASIRIESNSEKGTVDDPKSAESQIGIGGNEPFGPSSGASTISTPTKKVSGENQDSRIENGSTSSVDNSPLPFASVQIKLKKLISEASQNDPSSPFMSNSDEAENQAKQDNDCDQGKSSVIESPPLVKETVDQSKSDSEDYSEGVGIRATRKRSASYSKQKVKKVKSEIQESSSTIIPDSNASTDEYNTSATAEPESDSVGAESEPAIKSTTDDAACQLTDQAISTGMIESKSPKNPPRRAARRAPNAEEAAGRSSLQPPGESDETPTRASTRRSQKAQPKGGEKRPADEPGDQEATLSTQSAQPNEADAAAAAEGDANVSAEAPDQSEAKVSGPAHRGRPSRTDAKLRRGAAGKSGGAEAETPGGAAGTRASDASDACPAAAMTAAVMDEEEGDASASSHGAAAGKDAADRMETDSLRGEDDGPRGGGSPPPESAAGSSPNKPPAAKQRQPAARAAQAASGQAAAAAAPSRKRKAKDASEPAQGADGGPEASPAESARPGSAAGCAAKAPRPSSKKAPAAPAAAAAAAAAEAMGTGELEGWRTSGSAYIGARILRFELDEAGQAIRPGQRGVVAGWLSATEADFVSETTGVAAALWRVVYDDGELGVEDLEEAEVQLGIREFDLDRAANKKARGGRRPAPPPPAAAPAAAAAAAPDTAAAGEIVAPGTELVARVECVADIAARLGVDVDSLVAANRHRYPAISKRCRMRAGSILTIPAAAAAAASTAAAAAAAAAVPAAKAKAAGAGPGKGGGTSAARAGGAKAAPAAAAAPAAPRAEAVLPPRPAGADPWLAMAPDIRFPPYPLLTEEDGLLASAICIPFQCPFARVNGIICATTGYEAVAPCNAKVEDKWAVRTRFAEWGGGLGEIEIGRGWGWKGGR